MPFNVERARITGESEADIAEYLAKKHNFDVGPWRQRGMTDTEIVDMFMRFENQAPVRPDDPGAFMAGVYSAGETSQRWMSNLGLMEAPDEKLTEGLFEQQPVANVVGGLAPVLPTMFLPGGLPTQMAIGGFTGYLDDGIEGALRGAALSGFGAGAARVFGKGINALRQIPEVVDATDETTRIAGRAKDLGFNAFGQRARNSAANIAHATKLAARSIGINSDSLSPAALEKADGQLKANFQTIAKLISKSIQSPLDAEDLAKLGVSQKVLNTMDVNSMNGEQVMALRTEIGQALRAAGTPGNATTAVIPALRNALNDLDNAIGNVLHPNDQRWWGVVRERYRNFLAVDGGGIVIDDAGRLKPAGLKRKMERYWGKTFRHGKTAGLQPATADLFDTARIINSPQYVRSQVPGMEELTTSLVGSTAGAIYGGTTAYTQGQRTQDILQNAAKYGLFGYFGPRIARDVSAARPMPLIEQMLATSGRAFQAEPTAVPYEGMLLDSIRSMAGWKDEE